MGCLKLARGEENETVLRCTWNREKESKPRVNIYYYGARYYDPRVSIFYGVDPLAEKYPNVMPYAYAANSPVKFIDIDGMGPGDRVKAARSLIGTEYKQEIVSSMRTSNSSEALRYMDCAEFVCRVMSSDQITDGVKHMAGSSLKSFLDDKKKFEFSKTPKIGDIALWKDHVGIVTGVDKNGNIKLTHARGVGKLAKENSTFIKPEDYAPDSKFYGYYRPIEETPDGKLDKDSAISLNTNQPSSSAENSTMYFGGMLPEVIVSAKGYGKIKLDIKGIVQTNEK